MGKISFDEAQEIVKSRENQGNRIGFFALKNNKDSAVVRFLHGELADIETLAIHYVKTNSGKTRAVSCCRSPKEPIDMCPLCANARQGENMQIRYYIHMLQYKKNDKGEIEAEHVVFDRGSKFVNLLSSYAGRYHPLHKYLFEIERIGEAGSRETSYNIIPLPESENSKYPYYEDDLDYQEALGTIVAEKTSEQAQFFIQNGFFQEDEDKSKNNNANISRQPFEASIAREAVVKEAAPVQRTLESVPTSVVDGVMRPRRRV